MVMSLLSSIIVFSSSLNDGSSLLLLSNGWTAVSSFVLLFFFSLFLCLATFSLILSLTRSFSMLLQTWCSWFTSKCPFFMRKQLRMHPETKEGNCVVSHFKWKCPHCDLKAASQWWCFECSSDIVMDGEWCLPVISMQMTQFQVWTCTHQKFAFFSIFGNAGPKQGKFIKKREKGTFSKMWIVLLFLLSSGSWHANYCKFVFLITKVSIPQELHVSTNSNVIHVFHWFVLRLQQVVVNMINC